MMRMIAATSLHGLLASSRRFLPSSLLSSLPLPYGSRTLREEDDRREDTERRGSGPWGQAQTDRHRMTMSEEDTTVGLRKRRLEPR